MIIDDDKAIELFERVAVILSKLESMEKKIDKLPCDHHAETLTRLETGQDIRLADTKGRWAAFIAFLTAVGSIVIAYFKGH